MTLSFLKGVTPSPILRPQFNVGSLFDVQTGQYEYGYHGEAILDGGLAHVTGICGRGNSFKTVLLLFMFLRVLDRYTSGGMIYDTEVSLKLRRIKELSRRMINNLLNFDFNASERFVLTDKTKYNGTEWFDWLKEVTEFRQKQLKDDMMRTPFLNEVGKFIQMLIPFVVGIDSLSEFSSASVIKQQEDNSIGDSSRNTEALRDAASKTQMIREWSTLCENNGIYIITTMHIGDEHQLDPYSPPAKKLAFMKGKVKLKNVPEKASFLLNNIWNVMGTSVLANQKTKAPEFPRDADDDLKNDTDLMLLTMTNYRGKSGSSGFPFEIIVSQKDGLEEGLTDLYYLMTYGRYGMGGNLQNYNLDLWPGFNMSRTTVRRKLNESVEATRALEISSRLLQMINYRTPGLEDIMCTPKELYEGIKAKGYDWGEILNTTREWWTFDNDAPTHDLKFLSVVDLLNMRKGLYKPFWMT